MSYLMMQFHATTLLYKAADLFYFFYYTVLSVLEYFPSRTVTYPQLPH